MKCGPALLLGMRQGAASVPQPCPSSSLSGLLKLTPARREVRAWMLREAQTSLLLISSPECPHSCKPVSVSPVAVFPAFLPPTVSLAGSSALPSVVLCPPAPRGHHPLESHSEMGTEHLAVGSLDKLPPSPALWLRVPGPHRPEGQACEDPESLSCEAPSSST